MTYLKLFTNNVRGLRQKNKRSSYFDWLRNTLRYTDGFILLQETHSTSEDEKLWESEIGSKIIFNHGTTSSCGVMIILPENHDYEIECLYRDMNGRIVAIKVENNNDHVVIVNIYAPSANENDKIIFANELLECLEDMMTHTNNFNLMIGGDLNLCLLPELDSYSGRNVNSKYRSVIHGLIENYNLIDVWRTLNPELKRYTWRRSNPIQQSRLDYWFISTHILYNVKEIAIKASFKTDHSPLIICLESSITEKRGPGFWKFNSLLLLDEDYQAYIKGIIQMYKEIYSSVTDRSLKWDLIKMEIRSATIAYSKTQARLKREHEKEIYKKIEDLEVKINVNPRQQELTDYEALRLELEQILDSRTKGAIIRSKVKEVEYGEKNSKYFLNIEKSNYETKHIKKLINESGDTLIDPSAILNYEEQYYKKILQSDVSMGHGEFLHQTERFFDNLNLKTLSENNRKFCENLLTIDECKKAIDSLSIDKSPGSDGFNSNFYKHFWEDIQTLVFDSYVYSFEKGYLSIDQRRGILSLNPKKGKDIRYLKNWRPLTLLNTDYKIIAKVMGMRLRHVLPEIIHSDQVAYLKDRYIGQNIRVIDDVLNFSSETDADGIILCADFEKAFDSVEWSYIHRCLLAFNFGPNFIQWTRVMYNDISSCVLNNGYSSPFFKVTRGIRQGCPLSAYLFLLVAETLATGIRQDDNIKGFKIGYHEVLTVQMADDATLFLESPVSLQRSLLQFRIFGMISGLNLNLTKSEALGLGRYSHLYKIKPYGLLWKEKEICSLGIQFFKNPVDTIDVNCNVKLNKLQNLLNMWRPRNLSIKGKITVIKSLILPQILYICANLGVPEWFVAKVNTFLYHFLWSAKMDKVKRNTLINKIEHGGLKMIDIESMIQAQRIMWIKRFFNQSDGAGWKSYIHYKSSHFQIGPHDLLGCSLDPEILCIQWPLFYRQLLYSWYYIKGVNFVKTAWNIRRQTLIYNTNIVISNTYARHPYIRWFHAGIKQIHNLLDEKGYFISYKALSDRYGIDIDALAHNSLISAIPVVWKKCIKDVPVNHNAIMYEELPCLKLNQDEVPISLIINRNVYWNLVRIKAQPAISIPAWTNLLEIDQNVWSSIFRIPYEVSYDTRIQSFQYKIILRIFPCHYYVSKFDRSVDEICSFCNDDVDDICHYFYECAMCRHFWNKMRDFIAENLGVENVQDHINMKNIILGFTITSKYKVAINFIILHAKYYIYVMKMKKQNRLVINNFIQFLKSKLEINLIIAKNQNNSGFIREVSALNAVL